MMFIGSNPLCLCELTSYISNLCFPLQMMSVNIAQGLNDAVLVEADIDVRYRTAGRVLSCLQPAFSCLTAPLGLV